MLKIAALLFLFFILSSLASALYYMIKDKGQGTRAVRSLTSPYQSVDTAFRPADGGYLLRLHTTRPAVSTPFAIPVYISQ